jgi:voltage-gated potassium channel Kch
MSRHSLRQRLRYRFENTLSAGSGAVIGWLAAASTLIIVIASSLILLFRIPAAEDSTEPWSLSESLWNNLMRALDAGNLAGDTGWSLRLVSLLVTIGGIFIVAILIGSISSGIEDAITELRKGKSLVIEKNHTLILGWGPKVFQIISELVIANENQQHARIVVMADMDKVEMEDELRQKVPDTRNTRVICRTGSPIDLDDLKLVAFNDAKSIIVLSPEDSDFQDTFVIKSILAITNNPERKKEPFHITAEIRDARNLEAAKLVGGDELTVLLSADIISRLTAQTCRQSGLSVVYTELLDFSGAEIYTIEEKDLIGKTFREIIGAYNHCTVLGIRTADGQTLLNPPMHSILAKGDGIIVIAEDDDRIILAREITTMPGSEAIRERSTKPLTPERTLIMGWNGKAARIIQELDHYVPAGSRVLVVSEHEPPETELLETREALHNLTLQTEQADLTARKVIERIAPVEYDHIILLCDQDLPVQEADAKILISLLHLRNHAEQHGKDLNVVSEMRDVRNRTLAEVAKADDFIVSDNMISLLLAQISENKALADVFDRLFSNEGSEIYIRPVCDYIETGVEMDFHTLLESAAQKGETAIGFRIAADSRNPEKAYGVHCNPIKSQKMTFQPDDRIIVLAEG